LGLDAIGHWLRHREARFNGTVMPDRSTPDFDRRMALPLE
jgi:hypothetical protein